MATFTNDTVMLQPKVVRRPVAKPVAQVRQAAVEPVMSLDDELNLSLIVGYNLDWGNGGDLCWNCRQPLEIVTGPSGNEYCAKCGARQ